MVEGSDEDKWIFTVLERALATPPLGKSSVSPLHYRHKRFALRNDHSPTWEKSTAQHVRVITFSKNIHKRSTKRVHPTIQRFILTCHMNDSLRISVIVTSLKNTSASALLQSQSAHFLVHSSVAIWHGSAHYWQPEIQVDTLHLKNANALVTETAPSYTEKENLANLPLHSKNS